jgi:hypothetical protein
MKVNGKEIVICCPSYKRPRVETLSYLPFCKVYAAPEEYEKYLDANPKHNENIIKCDKGIQGNVARVRNYILEKEFENGADVVCLIDDDMKGIFHFEMSEDKTYAYEKVKLRKEQFFDFLYRYSVLCEEWGYKMWGVNCNSDSMCYRHYSPFSTTSIILGPFCVFLKGNECRYDEELPLKEDYDMFIQNCNKYRGVLRLNKYHYSCRQSEQKGGCAIYRNMEREKEQFELLRKKWGSNIVRLDRSNKGRTKKEKKYIDYNPIIKIPIKGI